MYKFAVLCLALIALIFVSAGSIHAVDLTVTCSSGGSCTVSPSGPLFDETGWKPGDSNSKELEIANTDTVESCNLTLVVNETDSQQGFDVASVLETNIDRSGTAYFDDNFRNLIDQGSTSLGVVPPATTHFYTWEVNFPIGSGNETQNRSVHFDFNSGFSCSGPSPTPGLTNAGPPHRTDEVTGTSSVAGAFTSFISNVLGTNAGEETASPTPTSGASVSPSPTPVGEVKGEATCSDPNNFWWIILIVQLAATGIFYFAIRGRKDVRFWWAVPVAFAIVSQIIHELMGCNCASGGLCPYYWAFNLIILLATAFLFKAIKED